MSYYAVSRIGQPSRLPMTLGDSLGQATYAGFPAANIAAYFGVSTLAAQGIINLANGAKLTEAQKAAVLALGPKRFKPGASGPHQGYGDITWGLAHLAQHPMGSHYHGGIGNLFKTIALNVATGGLYSVAKAGINIAKGGKVIPGLKDVAASQIGVPILTGASGGMAISALNPINPLLATPTSGMVLQPLIGTKKTLMLDLAAGTAGIAALPVAGMIGKVLPTATKLTETSVTGPTVAPVPSGLDPRYNPGYASTPLEYQYNPQADAGFGPNIDPTTGQPVAEAGFLGGLSPLALVALFGVPLVIQLFLKGRKSK